MGYELPEGFKPLSGDEWWSVYLHRKYGQTPFSYYHEGRPIHSSTLAEVIGRERLVGRIMLKLRTLWAWAESDVRPGRHPEDRSDR